jgi:hypothetical protein
MSRASKVLAVPILLTKNSKPHCGPVCAKMVLEFYGRRYSLKKIIARTETSEAGTTIWRLGTFFVREGFEVKIVAWVHHAFPNRFFNLDKDEARHDLMRWCRKEGLKKTSKNPRKDMLRFMEEGGIVVPRPVTVEDIRDDLSHGFPPILNVNAATLHRMGREKNAGHVIVPVLLSRGEMTYNDPAKGQVECALPLVMHACYIWDSSAIFIRPKKAATR